MNIPAEGDLIMFRGDTWDTPFNWVDSAGADVPLSTYSGEFIIYDYEGGSEIYKVTTTDDGNGNVIVLADEDPVIIVTITSAKTATFDFERGYYEFKIYKTVLGVVVKRTLFRGELILK